ncbi:MAG: heat-inducible transcriptional repressor HrcA [Bacteroidota bacterium]
MTSLQFPSYTDFRPHRELNERERFILRAIVHLYILTAQPVGSRHLSKYLERSLKLSPATLRNVMSDLEELQYISHPHTSAGRIPTDKGYRFYVDSLMDVEHLTEPERLAVSSNLLQNPKETILRDASKLLSSISRYLGVVEIPQLLDLVVQKIELITLSSTRLLVVIALDSNVVRTVTLESHFEIEPSSLDEISRWINERVSGRTLSFLKKHFAEVISQDAHEQPLIRLFVDSVDQLFSKEQPGEDRVHVAGAQQLLHHPEFDDVSRVRGIIELIEEEDVIIHLLDQCDDTAGGIKIIIGEEMENELLHDYSLIISGYQLGAATGSIGLIGPKRMNYSKMASLVQFVAKTLSHNP